MTDVHKLSGAYSVDALDDLERARFEQHLDECDDCRAEVRELREAAARLADTTATAPPAALRGSVLTAISQVRPLPPVTGAPPDRRRRPAWLPLLVAAVLVLVAGIGVAAWQPWVSPEPAPTAAERVLQAPDAETVAVDLGEAGRARVVRSASENRAVIITEDMVAAPKGKVYEVWFQTPQDDMVPAALMPPAPDQTVLLDGPAAEATAVGITIEPAGGSPAPTSEPIALFDFSEAS